MVRLQLGIGGRIHHHDQGWVGRRRPLTHGWTGNIASFLVGLGDGASGGLTAELTSRVAPSGRCIVRSNTGWYGSGVVTGVIATTVASGGSSATVRGATTAAKLTASETKSVLSYQRLIAEHEAKLADYVKNPLAYDNRGILAKAVADGDPARWNKIVDTRVRHLKSEIATFNDNIQKITGKH